MKEEIFYAFYSRSNGQKVNILYVGFRNLPRSKTLMKIQSYLGTERYRFCTVPEVYRLWNSVIPSISWTDLRLGMSYDPEYASPPELPFIDEIEAQCRIDSPCPY